MVRVVDGKSLTNADPGKVFMLRTFGNDGHQIWTSQTPATPSLVNVLQTGLQATHKNYWDEPVLHSWSAMVGARAGERIA